MHRALAGANHREHDYPTLEHLLLAQRAVTHVQWSGRAEVTGANVLLAIFAETESPAARLLAEQDMTRQDAVNFLALPRQGELR